MPFPGTPLVAVPKARRPEEYVNTQPTNQGRHMYGMVAGRVWLGEKGKSECEAQALAISTPASRQEQEETLRQAKEGLLGDVQAFAGG